LRDVGPGALKVDRSKGRNVAVTRVVEASCLMSVRLRSLAQYLSAPWWRSSRRARALATGEAVEELKRQAETAPRRNPASI